MRIDHGHIFCPPAYVRYLEGEAGGTSFLRAQRALYDLPLRLRVIEDQENYSQVLAPVPAPFVFGDAPSATEMVAELVRRNNDGWRRSSGGIPTTLRASSRPLRSPTQTRRPARRFERSPSRCVLRA